MSTSNGRVTQPAWTDPVSVLCLLIGFVNAPGVKAEQWPLLGHFLDEQLDSSGPWKR